MPQPRRMSNSSVASAGSHQSFPATVNSSTKVSKAKVGKIMSRRKNSRQTALERKKNTDKENGENLVLSPTPYWKVALERGTNRATPPKTRSTKKRKTDPSVTGTGLMIFSPPDQQANALREHEENERKLQERASRVQKARNSGRLLVFSPTFRNPVAMPPDANDQGENVEKSEEQTTFESRDTEESHESYETSTALPAYMEVEVSSHESEKSQLSVSTKADLVDKNSEEIKNELKCLRETLDQFVAKKTSSEETREHYKSLEMQMLRSENIIGENSKLRLQIEALEESLKEREAESTDTVERLQQKIAELQKELCAISSDAQIHTKALEEATRNLAEHVENSATEKGALLQQIDSLRAELEETRAKLLEKKAMLEALKDEFDVERRALTHERQKIHNSRGDLANQILELSMSNNSLKETIVEYETKIDSLENFLLPESEAQLEKALSQLRFFEENESKLHDQSSFYRQRIDELTHELTMARREQEQEREHFQQLNHDSSKAYEQIQKTIVEKDEIIERLTTKLEETSKASSVEKAKLKKMTHELQVVRSNMDTKTCELEELLRGVKSQLESSTKENKELEVKLSVALEEMKENAAFKKEVLTRSDATSAANQVLTQRIEQLMRELQRTKTEFDETKTRLATFDQREAELFTKLQESDRVRRGLHNRVMQLSGNIRVYVRVRPTIPGEENRGTETPSGNKKRKHVDMTSSTIFSYPGIGGNEALKSSLGADDPTKNILEVQEPWTDRGGLSERRKKWKFGFDNVFTPSHDQNDIWEATKPLVQSAIDGYNVTIFAYGQTGSGKTYTMLGEPDHEGIVARSVKMLFSGKGSIVELSRGKSQAEISVELLEVYNEKVRDLLDTGKPDDKGLKVKANQAVGSTLLQVSCEEEVIEILRTAQARRCVKATASNAVSSRSHMLFTLHFKVTSDVGHTRVGKLNVCDLAGSERLGKSNANEIVGGTLLAETKHINSSLSVLSNVIEKLQSGDSNVPYRESKLTHLLQNSLGGNSKTLAIVCCNPLQSHFHESLCSLRFAAKVNKIDLKAVANFSV